MGLTSKERHALFAQSHPLKPALTIADGPVSEAAITQLRDTFAQHALIKVRVRTDTGPGCDAVGQELAARVPCEVVKRVGRVVVLYRPSGKTPTMG